VSFLNSDALRESLIEKLITSLHLNVSDRRALGSRPVTVPEIAGTIKRLLDANGVFPLRAAIWRPGELVYEGHFLVRASNGTVKLHWQRGRAAAPFELAEQTTLEFQDSDKAIAHFILAEWPKGIDGIGLT
jgi:hypothetical protein